MTLEALLIQPHSDDVALALGGALHAGRLDARRAVLLTLFSRSPYARDTPSRDPDTVSKRRRGEDLHFAAVLGIPTVHFGDLPEALLRGIPWADLRSTPPDPATLAAVSQTLEQAAQRWPTAQWYAPLGLGGHVDHVLTSLAVRKLRRDALFYEDLPYAAFLEDIEPEGYEPAERIDIDVTGKNELLDCYPSQVEPKMRAAVLRYAQRTSPASEQLWQEHPSAPS